MVHYNNDIVGVATMIDFFHISANRYRFFGTPLQFRVFSEEDISNNIAIYNGKKDCFLSISEFESFGNAILSIPMFLPMDFDIDKGHNKSDVLDDVNATISWLKSKHLSYMLHDSGSKGWHVLPVLFTTIPADNNQLRGFYNFIVNELDISTLDSVCFEVRRLMRIPQTINIKSGKMCTEIETYEGQKLDLFRYTNIIKDTTCTYRSNTSNDIFKFPFPYISPCIDNKINQLDVSHDVRWVWVKLMQGRGYGADEIFDAASKMLWSDFNASYTRNQINYTMSKTVTISCDFIKSLGLCDDKKCPLRKKNISEK